jgi:hypothetical protein
MSFLDRIFQMGDGYVLNFSDKTFAMFFSEELNVDLEKFRNENYWPSKAKTLRLYLQSSSPQRAGQTLEALWAYRRDMLRDFGQSESIENCESRFAEIVQTVRKADAGPRTDGIERFAADVTLDELVSSIERDIQANKPEVAIDRLHTYCMKKFAYLLRQSAEMPNSKETLNSRAGRYFNPLRKTGKVRPISDKIMKTTVEIFELFNTIRNDSSLAHDNKLLEPPEARYIFDSVVSLLRFVKTTEGSRFGD